MTKQTQSKKESAKPSEEKPKDNTDVLLRIEALLGKTIEACNEVRDSVDRLAKKFSGVTNAKVFKEFEQAKGQWADKEKAKAASEKGKTVQRIRREMRKKMLQEAIDNGIDKLFVQTLKGLDMEGMKVISEAMKLVGIDYASSEDAVQKVKAELKSDNKVSGNMNITVKGLDVD